MRSTSQWRGMLGVCKMRRGVMQLAGFLMAGR